MDHAQSTESSLDALGALALAGDERAESQLFESLRVRFLSVAKRRVRQDHLEDLVQDALRIVFDRYGDRAEGRGILVWSLTVLRNVIGNHYQARRRESERMADVEDLSILPDARAATFAGTDAAELAEHLEIAVADLARRFPRCGIFFRELMASHEDGGGRREVSQRAYERVRRHYPEISTGSFYTALHRCRAHLSDILATMEGEVGHV